MKTDRGLRDRRSRRLIDLRGPIAGLGRPETTPTSRRSPRSIGTVADRESDSRTNPAGDLATQRRARFEQSASGVRARLAKYEADPRFATRSAVRRLLAALDATSFEASGNGARFSPLAEHRGLVRLVEAAFAARALEQGCSISREVPGPAGRTCDFLLERDGLELAVHFKHFDAAGAVPPPTLRPQERELESIPRSLTVSIRHADGWTPTAEPWFLREAGEFLESAHVGEERQFRDEADRLVGSVRVVATHGEDRVRLIPASATDLEARAARLQRLLRRAHAQFLPSVPNLILLGTVAEGPDPEGLFALSLALFGTPMERWDRFPPKGERIAHGRGEDGFWQGDRHADSQMAGWFSASDCDATGPGRWWSRNGAAAESDPLRAWITELVGPCLGDGRRSR